MAPRAPRYLHSMTMTTALPRPASRSFTPIAAVLLAAFGAFSLWVIATQGYLGFLALARREPWGLQLLLDLSIALGFAVAWMVPDARRRGTSAWPYAIAAVFTGSLAILAYCVLRPATPRPGT